MSGSGWLREEGAWQGETHVCSCCASEDVSAVWNHPIDVHYSLKVPPLQFSSSSLHKEPHTAKGLAAGAPCLFVEVWGEDELGRREVLSYGTSSIPMASGVHEVEVCTSTRTNRPRSPFLLTSSLCIDRHFVLTYHCLPAPLSGHRMSFQIHTWAPAGARSSLIETAFLGGRPFLAHDSVVWFTPHRAALAKETTLLAATGKGKGGRTGMQAGGGGNLPNSSGGGNQALQMTCAGSVKASVMVIARKLAPTADDYKGLEEGGAGGSVAGSHVD